jgi:hypothetical protein
MPIPISVCTLVSIMKIAVNQKPCPCLSPSCLKTVRSEQEKTKTKGGHPLVHISRIFDLSCSYVMLRPWCLITIVKILVILLPQTVCFIVAFLWPVQMVIPEHMWQQLACVYLKATRGCIRCEDGVKDDLSRSACKADHKGYFLAGTETKCLSHSPKRVLVQVVSLQCSCQRVMIL